MLACTAILIADDNEGRKSNPAPTEDQSVRDLLVVHDDADDDDSRAQREDKLRGLGAGNLRHFRNVNITALRGNGAIIASLKNDKKIRYVTVDRNVSVAGSAVYDQISVRTAVGLTPATTQKGTNIGVAVIDSGVNKLAGFGTTGACGTSRVVYSENFASDSGTADLYGHGTHVASILGSNASCDASHSTSVAPGVRIINLRALNAFGMGQDSAVIAAIDRAITLKKVYGIKVINLSLGRPAYESFTVDPLCQAAEKAWKAGIVVVAAAGNMGRSSVTNGYATISSPGTDPFVITVGAMRDPDPGLPANRTDDTITTFSSKGPTILDHIVKPDLVAPGNLMLARTAIPSTLTHLFPATVVSIPGDPGSYIKLSGTSMAAPVVSGAAALLIQKDLNQSPDQVKARLMKTAWKGMAATASVYDSLTATTYNLQHDLFTVGAGYIDIGAALASADKIGNSQSAVSPRAVVNDAGQVVLTSSYPNLSGLNPVWGTTNVWATNVVWGTNAVMANNVVWGANVVWGSNVSAGYNIVWGANIVWGTNIVWGADGILANTTEGDGDN